VNLKDFGSYFNYVVMFFVIYCFFVVKVQVMDTSTGAKMPIRYGDGNQTFAHKDMSSGTEMVYKRGYGDVHYSTLPKGYPLPSS